MLTALRQLIALAVEAAQAEQEAMAQVHKEGQVESVFTASAVVAVVDHHRN